MGAAAARLELVRLERSVGAALSLDWSLDLEEVFFGLDGSALDFFFLNRFDGGRGSSMAPRTSSGDKSSPFGPIASAMTSASSCSVSW